MRRNSISTITSCYVEFQMDAEEDEKHSSDDDAKLYDPITYETTLDNPSIADWIYVPKYKTQGFQAYSTECLKKLMNNHDKDVPDPLKMLPNLDSLRPRVIHFAKLLKDPVVRNIKLSQMDDKWKKNTLASILSIDQDKKQKKSIRKFSPFIGVKAWYDNNLIHDISIKESINIMRKQEVGAFLMRNSSKSHFDGRGQATIISTSIKSSTKKCVNHRWLIIHGIGIWCINDIKVLTSGAKTMMAHDLLQDLKKNHQDEDKPHFLSITSMVVAYMKKKRIDVKKLVMPDDECKVGGCD